MPDDISNSSIIRADWAPESDLRPASEYTREALLTLDLVARPYGAQGPWIDATTRRPISSSGELESALAAGVYRNNTDRAIIPDLGFAADFLTDNIRVSFLVGGTSEFAPGMALVYTPDEGAATPPDAAQKVIHDLAHTWNPASVAWTDTDVLMLGLELGYDPRPAPGALVRINGSTQDPFVGGEPMLNGTLHRLADNLRDVTAEVLNAASRNPTM